MALYRHEAKTRNRYHLGASFDLGFIRIKRELEAPRPKNRFLVKFGFSVKIHLYHPKGGLLCRTTWRITWTTLRVLLVVLEVVLVVLEVVLVVLSG